MFYLIIVNWLYYYRIYYYCIKIKNHKNMNEYEDSKDSKPDSIIVDQEQLEF